MHKRSLILAVMLIVATAFTVFIFLPEDNFTNSNTNTKPIKKKFNNQEFQNSVSLQYFGKKYVASSQKIQKKINTNEKKIQPDRLRKEIVLEKNKKLLLECSSTNNADRFQNPISGIIDGRHYEIDLSGCDKKNTKMKIIEYNRTLIEINNMEQFVDLAKNGFDITTKPRSGTNRSNILPIP